MRPKKILFSTDFSKNSVPARIAAIEQAKAFEAELAILHVVNPSPLGYPIFEEKIPVDMALLQRNIEESVREELDAVVEECKPAVPVVNGYYRTGDPAEEIVKFADEESVDLIAVGTHGWTGFKHLILGSTADKIVRTAKCPVLTVRGPEEE